MASATAATAAVTAGIEEREQRRISSERRLTEIRRSLAVVEAQEIDESDLRRALVESLPLWKVLTVPERERVIRMLIERIDYDGRDGSMRISYRLVGLAHLATEVATEEAS